MTSLDASRGRRPGRNPAVRAEEYRRVGGEKPDFKEFLLSGPDLSVLDLERQLNDFPREVDLTGGD